MNLSTFRRGRFSASAHLINCPTLAADSPISVVIAGMLRPDFRWAEPAKVHVRSRVGSIDSSSKYLDNCDVIKALHWLGSSLEDVSGFPIEARRQLGFELFAVQVGQMPSDFKPMPQIGKGAYEIRVHVLGEWRLVYVARQADKVFVLHAFHKKTQKTRKADLQLAARRYQQMTGE